MTSCSVGASPPRSCTGTCWSTRRPGPASSRKRGPLRASRTRASWRVYDVAADEVGVVTILEHVPGWTLSSTLRTTGRLPIDEAVRIGAEVAEALEHAHQRGVIHRDVKPGNVLIDESGRARLADFGIARVLGEEASRVTAAGTITGTLLYLAPEQLSGQDVDQRADIYGVGLLLYEMLAGHPAYRVTTPYALAEAMRTPPTEIPNAPPSLAAIVGRAMHPDRERRHPTGAALATELRAWLRSNEPGRAATPEAPIDRRRAAPGWSGPAAAAADPGGAARVRGAAHVRPAGPASCVAGPAGRPAVDGRTGATPVRSRMAGVGRHPRRRGDRGGRFLRLPHRARRQRRTLAVAVAACRQWFREPENERARTNDARRDRHARADPDHAGTDPDPDLGGVRRGDRGVAPAHHGRPAERADRRPCRRRAAGRSCARSWTTWKRTTPTRPANASTSSASRWSRWKRRTGFRDPGFANQLTRGADDVEAAVP